MTSVWSGGTRSVLSVSTVSKRVASDVLRLVVGLERARLGPADRRLGLWFWGYL